MHNFEIKKQANFILWLVIVVFSLLHLYNITAPPNGYHQWRESDTAAISLNYYQEDMNFLHPRVNQRGAGSGITGSELPIFNYSAALLYKVFGPSHVLHRLLTLFAGVISIWLLFYIVLIMTKDKSIAIFTSFAFAFSPLFFFYSYKIMPDIWMLTFLLASVFFYLKFLESNAKLEFGLSAILLVLSATIKPLSLGVYLFYFIRGRKSKFKNSYNYIVSLIFISMTFIPTICWYIYARHVNEIHQTPGFYLGGMLGTFYTYLLTSRFYKILFLQWPFELWIGWPLVIFFIIGSYQIFKRKLNFHFFVWIVTCYGTFFLISHHSSSHDYYTLIVVPPFAAITGVGLNQISQLKKYGKVIIVLIMLLIPIATFLQVEHRLDAVLNFDQVRLDTAKLIPTRSLVMVEDCSKSIKLYQLNRKGWPLMYSITYSGINQYISQGGEYLVLKNEINNYEDSISYLFESSYVKIDELYCYRIQK